MNNDSVIDVNFATSMFQNPLTLLKKWNSVHLRKEEACSFFTIFLLVSQKKAEIFPPVIRKPLDGKGAIPLVRAIELKKKDASTVLHLVTLLKVIATSACAVVISIAIF